MAVKQSSLIIGRQPLIEALESGRAIDKILLQKNTGGDIVNQIRQLARERQVPIQPVPVEKLNSLTRANHQGVLALSRSATGDRPCGIERRSAFVRDA
jgi:23S rRNA (guanosine2251-2'-O)-methyltransferase